MRNFSDKIPCICLGLWTLTHPRIACFGTFLDVCSKNDWMVVFSKEFGTLDPHLPINWDKVPKNRFFYTFPYSNTSFSCPHYNKNQLLQQPTNIPNVQMNLLLFSKYLWLSNSFLIVQILGGQTQASGYIANFFHLQQSSSPPGITCLIWTLWIRFFIGRSSFCSRHFEEKKPLLVKPLISSSLGLSDFVFKTRGKCV